ncbi:hypothetical protein [Dongia sp.]|uniref:hypothetical protein n=1 Tax=Dongia sp. TaxID=1977262 RepID=UPI0035B1A838
MIRLATDTQQAYDSVIDGRIAPTRDQYSDAMSNAADLANQSWSAEQAGRDIIDTQAKQLGAMGFEFAPGTLPYAAAKYRTLNDNQPLTEDFIVSRLPGRAARGDTRTDEQILADKKKQAAQIIEQEAAWNQAVLNSQTGKPHDDNGLRTTDQIVAENIKKANEAEAKANDYAARIRDRSWDIDLYYGAKTAVREPLNIAGAVITAPIAAEAIAANLAVRLLALSAIEGGVGAASQMGVEKQMETWYRARGLSEQEIDDRWYSNVGSAAATGAVLGPLGYLLGKGAGAAIRGVNKARGSLLEGLAPAERAAALERARALTPDQATHLAETFQRLTATRTDDELFDALRSLDPDKLTLSAREMGELSAVRDAYGALQALPEHIRSNPQLMRPYLSALGRTASALQSDGTPSLARLGAAQLGDLQLDATILRAGSNDFTLADLDAFPEVKATLLRKGLPEGMTPAAYKVLGLQQAILEATARNAPADEIAKLTAQAEAIRAKLPETEQQALTQAEGVFATAREHPDNIKGTAFNKADVIEALTAAKAESAQRVADLRAETAAQRTTSPESEEALDAAAQTTRNESDAIIAQRERSLNTNELDKLVERDGRLSLDAMLKNESLPQELRDAMLDDFKLSREESEALEVIEACLLGA